MKERLEHRNEGSFGRTVRPSVRAVEGVVFQQRPRKEYSSKSLILPCPQDRFKYSNTIIHKFIGDESRPSTYTFYDNTGGQIIMSMKL